MGQRGSRGAMRALWRVVAVAAVAAAGCILLTGRQPQTAELLNRGRHHRASRAIGLHHRLTAQEKEFVQQATSTPDLDLHRATKLQSERASAEMARYYSKQALALKKRDSVARAHLAAMHKRASTKAAKTDLDRYFASMAQAVKTEHAVEVRKHAGRGAAARAESNLYFKQLQAKQSAENKADEARLRAESHFHSRHGTAVAATKDLNHWWDTLQAKTKQADIKRAKKHAATATNPYSFVTPVAARQGGEAVKVHKHDEEGIEMSTQQADDDLSSYFDKLDAKGEKVNQHDIKALADNDKFAAKRRKPSAIAAQREISTYFHAQHAKTLAQDQRDRARLRKDSLRVNLQEGVNYGTLAAAKARASAKKAATAKKVAMRQRLKQKQALAHKLEGRAVGAA